MRVLLTGASGQLGPYVLDALVAAGHEVRAWTGQVVGERSGVRLEPVDLADPVQVTTSLERDDPAAVVHAAALSTIDGVRREPERAWAVNVVATERIAAWCAERGRRLIQTSTDQVFDGKRPGGGYAEDEPTGPLTAYGRTKLAAEPAVLATPGGVVARLSLLYGPARGGRANLFDRTVAGLRSGTPQTFFADEFRTPLDLATAAAILARLLTADFAGRLHVGGAERLSRFELARRIAVGLGLDPTLVRANRQADATAPEPRAADVSLDTSRLQALFPTIRRPGIEEAVVAMSRRG